MMTATTREESALFEGIRRMLEEGGGLRAKMAVSGEATKLRIYLGHRGKMEFNVRVQGKTAHSSNPSRGINAIYKMCDFVRDLREHYRLPSHPVFGDATFTIKDIVSSPGRLGPIIPDLCEILLERRYFPGESAVSIQGEIEALIARRREQDPDFNASTELIKNNPPFYCPKEEPIVSILQGARQAVVGNPGELGVWRFGVEGAYIQRAGIPCAGFGPGDEYFAYTPEEHLAINDLITSCRIYAEIIRRACCS